jgi:hypothetical protein
MDFIAFVFGAFGAGVVVGYLLATHIHSVAAGAVSAAQRAVTVPSGDIAKLNATVSGLGNQVAAVSADLKQHVTDTVIAAVAALPQQPGV